MKYNTCSSRIEYVAECSDGFQYNESGYYCFGRFLSKEHILDKDDANEIFSVKYCIKIYSNGYGRRMNKKHDVFLKEEELRTYFNWVSQEYGIGEINLVPLSVTEDNPFPGFSVSLSVEGLKRKHLWILNMIRMTYEYPFNLYLREAFDIKHGSHSSDDEYECLRSESYINLIQVILSAGEINNIVKLGVDHGYLINTDQSPFYRYRKLESHDSILEKLSLPGRVLDIYDDISSYLVELHDKALEFKGTNVGITLINKGLYFGYEFPLDEKYKFLYSEFWLDDNPNNIKIRRDVYKNMYNLLKK